MIDFSEKPYNLFAGDCLETLRKMPDNCISAVCTDPPYGLSDHKPQDVVDCLTAWLAGKEYKPNKRGFCGRSWDAWVPGPEVWREVFRVLKPGGHVVAFAGSRTHDLMSMALRLAGFECRDTVMWVYGSGFPKSMDVSKSIDKMAGAEREIVGQGMSGATAGMQALGPSGIKGGAYDITAPATDAARQWQGWGTALKPAFEPALLFRKPLIGTVAANVLAHGTGAINVDGCRIGTEPRPLMVRTETVVSPSSTENPTTGATSSGELTTQGRWPANIILQDSDEIRSMFPDSTGSGGSVPNVKVTGYGGGIGTGESKYLGGERKKVEAGSGSAARFFYCAKASRKDRSEGMESKEYYYLNEDVPSDVLEKIYAALAK